MTEVTNHGRLQLIVGSPTLPPGKCVVCGTAEGTFVDLGFDIDFYGVVYFCRSCITEVLGVLDFVPVEQLKASVDELDIQVGVNKALFRENEELKHAIDSLMRAGYAAPESVSSDVDVDEDIQESDTEPELVDSEPTESESRPVEQTDEPRPASVHNDESLNIFDL